MQSEFVKYLQCAFFQDIYKLFDFLSHNVLIFIIENCLHCKIKWWISLHTFSTQLVWIRCGFEVKIIEIITKPLCYRLCCHSLPIGTVNQQFLHVDEGLEIELRTRVAKTSMGYANQKEKLEHISIELIQWVTDENHLMMLRQSKQIKHIQNADTRKLY